MNPFYARALTRSVIATIIIGAWTIWYDGPQWSWFLLAFYIAFTFGLATIMEKRIQKKIAERDAKKADDA